MYTVLVLTKGNKNITNIFYFLNFINFILLRYKGIAYLIFGVLHTSFTCLYFLFLHKHCYMCRGSLPLKSYCKKCIDDGGKSPRLVYDGIWVRALVG